MTAVAGGTEDKTIRIKVLRIITPLKTGDRVQTKEILQQYSFGKWRDVEKITETITMESETE